MSTQSKLNLTVREIVNNWLSNRQSEIKGSTLASYKTCAGHIIGPLLLGSRVDRIALKRNRILRQEPRYAALLGDVLVADLTTAKIRAWHQVLCNEVSVYTANAAKKALRSALALAAEDFHIAVPAMPTRLGRGRPKPVKPILSTDQVGRLLAAAFADKERGIYYAFPFLT